MISDPLLSDDVHRWRACPRRFWLHQHGGADRAVAPPAFDPRAEASIVHGPAPDAALRASFPGAVALAAPHGPTQWALTLQRTAECLTQPRMQRTGQALFGACLASDDGAQVRIDVVVRGTQGMHLFKVRYATVADEADVDAVALWTHVAARCGWRVQSAGLLLVDTSFLYPGHGCYAGVFREVDLAPSLGSRPVAAWLMDMRDCRRGSQPSASPGAQCQRGGPCEYAGHCGVRASAAVAAARVPQDIASLDIVGREAAAELRRLGHTDLRNVPEALLFNARHRRSARAIRQDTPVLDSAGAAALRAEPYPRHLLRFDTIGFAVPVWPGTRPYQVLPFQWTCDVLRTPGEIDHHAFLAGVRGDPRREFATTLLQVLGDTGPVFAYNAGFERNRIRDLAQCFDDLSERLEALLPRIVDLFQFARANYYHPQMRGSWSFRSMCRAIAPELQADRLPWHRELTSQEAFAESLQRDMSDPVRHALREALLDRGRRQAAALRRMVERFEGA